MQIIIILISNSIQKWLIYERISKQKNVEMKKKELTRKHPKSISKTNEDKNHNEKMEETCEEKISMNTLIIMCNNLMVLWRVNQGALHLQ